MGTAAPPPGVGIGEAHQAEVIRLSLQKEEMVVLISDGLESEETQSQIADFTGQTPQALAAALVAAAPGRRGRRPDGGCSLPAPPCRRVQHSIFCPQSLSKHKILDKFFGRNHKMCHTWEKNLSTPAFGGGFLPEWAF